MQMFNPVKGIQACSGMDWPGVKYFSTWRTGGVSKGPFAGLNMAMHVGDDPSDVMQNRMQLRQALPADPVWLNQVHSTDVHIVNSVHDYKITTADALVSTQKNIPLAIMTADCLPVVIAGFDGSVVGVAHAGWRGLKDGILENTVQAIKNVASTGVLQAWIGPAIGFNAFQVGAEVQQAFVSKNQDLNVFFKPIDNLAIHGSATLGKQKQFFLADLSGIAKHILLTAGLAMIETSDECTYTEADRYYSYRRDGRTGRQVTVAWLT